MPVNAMPAFDTYKYYSALKAAGVPEAQAGAQSSALAEAFDTYNERLATKDDLRQLSTELRGDMKQLSTELHGNMKQLSTELRGDMRQLSTELRGEMDKMRLDLQGQITQLKWMLSPIALCMVALMLNLFKTTFFAGS